MDARDRIEAGRGLVLVEGAELPSGLHRPIVRVRCTPGPLSPWTAAVEALSIRLDAPDRAARRVVGGLRRRLLGDANADMSPLLADVDELCGATGAALVLDDAAVMDAASVRVGVAALRDPHFRAPLVLRFVGGVSGPAEELVRALVEREGADVVVGPGQHTASEDPFAGLDPEARRVLRAFAVLGGEAPVPAVAAALGADPVAVLEMLQIANDGGFPIGDDGTGDIAIPPELAERLAAEVLPSLATAWSARAELAMAQERGRAPAAAPPEEATSTAPPEPLPAPPEPVTPPAAAVEPAPPATPPPWAATRSPRIEIRRHKPKSATPTDAEALLGDLAYARALFAQGRAAEALTAGEALVARIGDAPTDPRLRHFRSEVLAELGQIQADERGPDDRFSLPAALATLEAGLAGLGPQADPQLEARLRSLIAGVCYDIGDPRSLQRAYEELSVAIRSLQAAGDARGAAQLLNDQAAVLVALGDPVQAAYLLRQSRAVFEARAPHDPVARIEAAETAHLMARLVLDVPAREGQEAAALEAAQRHALAAEAGYRASNAPRETARVWATRGLLSLRQGRPEQAIELLAEAATAQRALGDAVGLARTTESLAEAMLQLHQAPTALEALAQSVMLNLEKGSPEGIAHNRGTLSRIQRHLRPEERVALAATIEQLTRTLTD